MTELPPELRKELLTKRLALMVVGRPKYCPQDNVDQSPDETDFDTPLMDLDEAQQLCRRLLNLKEKDRLNNTQRSKRHKFENRFKYAAEKSFENALRQAENGLEGPIKEVSLYLY